MKLVGKFVVILCMPNLNLPCNWQATSRTLADADTAPRNHKWWLKVWILRGFFIDGNTFRIKGDDWESREQKALENEKVRLLYESFPFLLSNGINKYQSRWSGRKDFDRFFNSPDVETIIGGYGGRGGWREEGESWKEGATNELGNLSLQLLVQSKPISAPK